MIYKKPLTLPTDFDMINMLGSVREGLTPVCFKAVPAEGRDPWQGSLSP